MVREGGGVARGYIGGKREVTFFYLFAESLAAMENLIRQTQRASATFDPAGPPEDIPLKENCVFSSFLVVAAKSAFNIRISAADKRRPIASVPAGVKTWAETLSCIFKSDPTNSYPSIIFEWGLKADTCKFRLFD